jgi:hypothetical protein
VVTPRGGETCTPVQCYGGTVFLFHLQEDALNALRFCVSGETAKDACRQSPSALLNNRAHAVDTRPALAYGGGTRCQWTQFAFIGDNRVRDARTATQCLHAVGSVHRVEPCC